MIINNFFHNLSNDNFEEQFKDSGLNFLQKRTQSILSGRLIDEQKLNETIDGLSNLINFGSFEEEDIKSFSNDIVILTKKFKEANTGTTESEKVEKLMFSFLIHHWDHTNKNFNDVLKTFFSYGEEEEWRNWIESYFPSSIVPSEEFVKEEILYIPFDRVKILDSEKIEAILQKNPEVKVIHIQGNSFNVPIDYVDEGLKSNFSLESILKAYERGDSLIKYDDLNANLLKDSPVLLGAQETWNNQGIYLSKEIVNYLEEVNNFYSHPKPHSLQFIDEENIGYLLEIANFLQLNELKKSCIELLFDEIDVNNIENIVNLYTYIELLGNPLDPRVMHYQKKLDDAMSDWLNDEYLAGGLEKGIEGLEKVKHLGLQSFRFKDFIINQERLLWVDEIIKALPDLVRVEFNVIQHELNLITAISLKLPEELVSKNIPEYRKLFFKKICSIFENYSHDYNRTKQSWSVVCMK